MDGDHAITQSCSSLREERLVFRMDGHYDAGNLRMGEERFERVANNRPSADPTVLFRSFSRLTRAFAPPCCNDYDADRCLCRNVL